MRSSSAALYRALLSRERGDGSEIGRLQVTYLITDGSCQQEPKSAELSGSE
jgi:hypothetical protein